MSQSVRKGLSVIPSRARKVVAGVAIAFASTAPVMAATLEEAAGGFTVDTSPLFVMMAVILTAIGGIWAVKKMIALGNKS